MTPYSQQITTTRERPDGDLLVVGGSAQFLDACQTEFTFETTGYRGGDAGHGGYAEVSIKDLASTALSGSFNEAPYSDGNAVKIRLEGDAEISNLILGLEWLVQQLKQAIDTASDPTYHRQ